jgi:hypothetical protein
MLLLQEAQQLTARVVLLYHPVTDVGTVEAGGELPRLLQAQLGHDLVAGRGIGGGGQRDARHLRPAFVEQLQLDVLRAEVVPPLGDAVGLVDGEQGDGYALQQVEKAPGQQPLNAKSF